MKPVLNSKKTVKSITDAFTLDLKAVRKRETEAAAALTNRAGKLELQVQLLDTQAGVHLEEASKAGNAVDKIIEFFNS